MSRLAEKYTAFEDSSVTYEKAEQLMEAVLYCIRELERSDENLIAVGKELCSAQQAYETGYMYVKKKTGKALEMYNELLTDFADYGNVFLKETVIKGLPEFFKWYDVKFEPQNTWLTLDYPVLRDISGYTGIDKIYEYLKCIRLEQMFLNRFPEAYIINILSKQNAWYEEMAENICEVIFTVVTGGFLAEKILEEPYFTEPDHLRIQQKFKTEALLDINRRLKRMTDVLVETYYENCKELSEYLQDSVEGITIRLKNAADHSMLFRFLPREEAEEG